MTGYRFKVVVIFIPLREMCPNRKLFLVRIFPHSDWIRRDKKYKYLSVCSPNAGKYGPEITPYLDTFYAVFRVPNIVQRELLIILTSSKPVLQFSITYFHLIIVSSHSGWNCYYLVFCDVLKSYTKFWNKIWT